MYVLLHTHLTLISIAFVIFFVRGVLMFNQSDFVNHKFFMRAPHLINAALIGTGIALMLSLGLSPTSQPWLLAKLTALVFFIGCGVMAFKIPSMQLRRIFWVIALVLFGYMAAVAHTKNPLIIF